MNEAAQDGRARSSRMEKAASEAGEGGTTTPDYREGYAGRAQAIRRGLQPSETTKRKKGRDSRGSVL